MKHVLCTFSSREFSRYGIVNVEQLSADYLFRSLRKEEEGSEEDLKKAKWRRWKSEGIRNRRNSLSGKGKVGNGGKIW